ncbi:MAG: extracellular solute-binding protein [Caldilineaceae bacterium]|nr:extracellular solute-binding protein [Caldilineaceae bacterium]
MSKLMKQPLSRRQFLAGVGGTSLAVTLAACATPAAGPNADTEGGESADTAAVNLRFISNHGEADQALFEKVIENFQAAHPDIQIEYLDIAGQEFYNAINTQGVGGELPDVWYTRTFDVPVYASKGWTTNLQPLIERDAEEVNVDDFWPAEVAQMQWQGDLYALPYDFSNVGIYFNKQMFDDAGIAYPTDDWQWSDLRDLALNFVEQDGGTFTKWGLQLFSWNWVWHGMILGWGGEIFGEGFKEILINSPESVDLFAWFAAAREEGMYPEAGAAPAGVDPFAAGVVAMAFQGSWATNQMRANIGDKFDFDCVALPKSPDGASCINGAGGAWGIASNTENVEAAWTFNKFLTSTESTNILISEPLRSIPGRQSSVAKWNEVASEGNLPPANVGIFPQQMETGQAAPYPPYWQDYGNAWTNIVVPFIDGTIDTDASQMLADFSTEVERIIEQNMSSLS